MLLIDFVSELSEILEAMQKVLDQVQDLGTKARTELRCSENDLDTLNLTKTIQKSLMDVLSTLNSEAEKRMLNIVPGTLQVPMTISQPPPCFTWPIW
jgi:hypothetical protein